MDLLVIFTLALCIFLAVSVSVIISFFFSKIKQRYNNDWKK